MNSLTLKILAVLLIFLGELFAVYAETFGVKYRLLSGGFWRVLIIMSIGGLFLITGYVMGYKTYQNLWVLTVVSITTLLIAEPLVIIYFFGETPTIGATIGFVLGVIGLFAAILF